ncbi:MAG: DedA family protein [Patescibacteria group bacterium]
MDFSSFAEVVGWVMTHSYPLIFLVMVIEGPIVTAAASFAAALGHLNYYAIFILSFLGDLMGDLIYYSIGYWGRQGFIEKHGKRLGLTKERIERVTTLIKTHPIKTLITSKYIPLVSASGLIGAGLAHIPLRRFLLLDILITLPSTIFFTTIGFYFGVIFDSIFKSIRNAQYAAAAVIVLAILFFLLYRKVQEYLSRQLEKNGNGV